MTSKLISGFSLALALSLAASAQSPAPAAAPATPAPSAAPAPAPAPAAVPAAALKIGVINLHEAIVSTNEGQRDFQALEQKFQPKSKELDAAGAKIEELMKKLKSQGPKMTKEEGTALARQIEAKQKQFKREYEEAQQNWGAAQKEILERVGPKLVKAIDKYAAENGYWVILSSSPESEAAPTVVWKNPSSDVTKGVVAVYNSDNPVK